MNQSRHEGEEPETGTPETGSPETVSPESEASREGAEAAEAAEPAPADAEKPSLEQQLEAALAKAEENRDAYLRASAELDNVRRRAEREVANAQRFALEKPMSDLLGAIDSLELGLKSAEDEAAGKDAVLEGMRLTLKQLVQALERHGLSRLEPAGEAFDPERHEAVSMVESADVPPQHVHSVMQAGYLLNERLLRPAMVIVARAPSD